MSSRKAKQAGRQAEEAENGRDAGEGGSEEKSEPLSVGKARERRREGGRESTSTSSV